MDITIQMLSDRTLLRNNEVLGVSGDDSSSIITIIDLEQYQGFNKKIEFYVKSNKYEYDIVEEQFIVPSEVLVPYFVLVQLIYIDKDNIEIARSIQTPFQVHTSAENNSENNDDSCDFSFHKVLRNDTTLNFYNKYGEKIDDVEISTVTGAVFGEF